MKTCLRRVVALIVLCTVSLACQMAPTSPEAQTPVAQAPVSTPPPTSVAPVVESFVADRTGLAPGDYVTFSWRAQGTAVFFCRGRLADPPCQQVTNEGSLTVYIDRRPDTTDYTYYFGLFAATNPAPDWGPTDQAEIAIQCLICIPPTLTPAPTSTPFPEIYRDSWSTYANEDYGFVFDYPTYYSAIGCGVREVRFAEQPTLVLQFGSQSSLLVQPANGLDLKTYVDQAIRQLGFEAQHYHRIDEARFIRDPRGIVVETVSLHHPITLVFFQRGDEIFEFTARHDSGCIAPEIGFSNPDTFYRIVRSFRFTR